MKGIWTGGKGKRRWYCHDCPRHFGTKRAARAHQELEAHFGITRGAVQWG